ncbi:CPBP family intramembrane metalloprotease, partial [Candidatus Pacearchaeota archaeon]|nr:CPBP family intramembrane metalloprotease [Candidatus Pacearchaeota archaeon]
EREINKQLSSGIFLTILSYLATIFMFILAFIFLIKAFINKKANWKSYLLLSLITLAILIVSTINEYPTLKSSYITDSPFLVHIGIAIAIGIIISILFVSTIFISGVSGDFLAKEVWKEKIKNTLKKLSPSIFRGYLIAFSSLGLVSLLYLIGERYLGVWALSSGAESYSFLLSFIPFISIFSIVFFAAFSEEIIYRLFGISFFKKYLKSTFFAILLSTLVWAVAHSSYPVFPFYFRAIELIIGGSIWGYFFVRYDLSTVISAHYVYNAVLFGSIMFFTGTLSLMISAVTLVLLPLILIPLNQFLIKRA